MFHPSRGNKSEADNPLVVIHDEPQSCPYIDGNEARMPLQWPMGMITPETLDNYLAEGYRRSGPFLYRTQCPSCEACEATRLDVSKFQFTKSLRRVLKRGDRELEIRIGGPQVDERRVEIFNSHRKVRHLGISERQMDTSEYVSFLVDTICETKELTFWHAENLIGVATTDFGRDSISLVYCHFDPEYSGLSIGTYSILKHIELAIANDFKFVYLGLYVASNRHLNYKSRFRPQQRLLENNWQEITEEA